MEPALKTLLLSIAPEFTTTPDPMLDAVFAEVSVYVDRAKFGDIGIVLAMAHVLSLAARAAGGAGGAVGAVTAESEGQLSRSYGGQATGAGASAFWGSTTYGARLWQMIRAKLMLARNRMC